MSMVKPILTTSVLIIAILAMITPGSAQEPFPQPPTPNITATAYVAGEILVKFQPHVGLFGAQGSLRGEGLRPLQASPRSGVLRVEVQPGREAEIIADLLARGDVEFATLNYRIQAIGDPNDPSFSLQWALKQAQDHDIDAPEAWDIHTGGDQVTVAIVDTGVDLDHPDLQAKIVPGYDFANGDNAADDDHGHGTHVAGIAAAATNNSTGVAGVSWGANIMPLKVLDAGGNGNTFDLAQAIFYAVDHGAQVINMSLGGGCGLGWPEVEAAVNYARTNGVFLAAASGNTYASTVMCPAAINGVMAVGATDANDNRAAFSNYGSELDVMAPGLAIYSTVIGGGYGYMSGTSMASPHVAGLAAVLKSFNPSFTGDQITNFIQDTAEDLGTVGWDQQTGYGRINAWQALSATSLQTTPDQLTLFVDDDSGSDSGNIQIITANPSAITWTAGISPAVSWLDVSPPASGTLSTASSPADLTIVATQPATYSTYVTTIVITGTNGSGDEIGPNLTEVTLHYVPKVYEYYFPLFFKN